MRFLRNLIFFAVIFAILAPKANACSVCYGAAGSQMTVGLHMAVLTLLLIVFAVLGAFALFIFNLNKRSKLQATQ